MPWPDLADRVLQTTIGRLGIDCTWDPGGPDEATVRGVFNAQHEVTGSGDFAVSGVAPALGVRLADLPVEPQRGHRVRVNAVDYLVEDVQPDGNQDSDGKPLGALLVLEREV